MSGSRVLEMKNISKSFFGIKALDDVSIFLNKGEILGLLGENGAGKSTLIKILAGTYQKDSGSIYINGTEEEILNPAVGKKLGIEVIYQELNTLDYLSITENIFLGELQSGKFGIINWAKMKKQAKDALNRLNIDIDPSTPMKNLTTGQKQIVEIVRSLAKEANIIVMDEPTAALGEKEEKILFSIISELKNQGISIIYISHKLDEIFKITDKVVVLRDGKCVGERFTENTNKDELIEMMVGRKLDEMYPKKVINIGKVIMEVSGYSYRNIFKDISFKLRKGEILGFFGLMGSGRTALLNSIFGAHPKGNGILKIEEKEVKINCPITAKRNNLGLLPISRKEDGVAISMSVENNITLSNIDSLGKGIFLDRTIERNEANKWIEDLNIKSPSLEAPVSSLSGGNQQKVALAKWLERGSNIFLLNEPTRGIDVGSKVEIYTIIEKLCEEGNAVIMSSSELQEIISIPDRVIVMAEGRITRIFSRKEIDKEKLMHAASM